MKGKLTWSIFWALVGIFVVIVSVFFIPAARELLMGFLFIIISGAAFFLLGVALIILTVKEKVRGTLKKFLLLTGASAAGFLSLFSCTMPFMVCLFTFLAQTFGTESVWEMSLSSSSWQSWYAP